MINIINITKKSRGARSNGIWKSRGISTVHFIFVNKINISSKLSYYMINKEKNKWVKS